MPTFSTYEEACAFAQSNPGHHSPTTSNGGTPSYTVEKARTLAQLAQEALAVQDACNLSSVVHGFSRAMKDLCVHVKATDGRNTHPIVRLWVDKLVSLSGEAGIADYDAVRKLADGQGEQT